MFGTPDALQNWQEEVSDHLLELGLRSGKGKSGDDKEIRVLNCGIRYEEDGMKSDTDQRHAESIVDAKGLADCAGKGLATPADKE